jgi:hypothetical protein
MNEQCVLTVFRDSLVLVAGACIRSIACAPRILSSLLLTTMCFIATTIIYTHTPLTVTCFHSALPEKADALLQKR